MSARERWNNCPHPNLADKENRGDWLNKGKDAPSKPPANNESDSDEPEWASMVEELGDLNRMRQEANSTSARAADEEDPVGVQHYIWLLTQIVLLTSWAPSSFHGKAVITVVTLCDGNVTNRHDVTANL